mgnify:CR=1 FL=1
MSARFYLRFAPRMPFGLYGMVTSLNFHYYNNVRSASNADQNTEYSARPHNPRK